MKRIFPCVALTLAAASQLIAQSSSPLKNAVVPILDTKSGYLLGGSRNGKWVDAKTTAGTLKSASNYRVFSATSLLGTARATPPRSEGAPCEDTLFSKISPDFKAQKGEFALGGARNPMPRAVRLENTNQTTYRNIVAAILRAKGIAKPVVQIAQIWRVDLDGDGTSEVLLTATQKENYGDPQRIAPNARAGDYSLVLLRKIVGGKAQNILLESEVYPRPKEFNAPNFFRLGAVLDANGDGKMEVLVRGAYYEGEWTSLYEIGAKPREVLSEGCGA